MYALKNPVTGYLTKERWPTEAAARHDLALDPLFRWAADVLWMTCNEVVEVVEVD